MADVVQYRMERMADELDDLERRGLFSRAEIAEVVRRRRDFEFRLRRPQPLKGDYRGYADYERRFDDLRRLRKRAIIRQSQGNEDDDEEGEGKRKWKRKKWKKSVSDFAGVSRILDIYRLATTRYKGDLDLWLQYLEFCRKRRHGRMKQVLAQAVRYHPKVAGLWIYAAAWEFDQNLNVGGGRALMYSGIRYCPKSEDLWIEFLRMELTYLNKLKARKIVLGEDIKTVEHNSEMDKNSDDYMPLNDQEEALDSSGSFDVLGNKANPFYQQGLELVKTIYEGAVGALPSSLTLRKKILEILDSVDLADFNKLKIVVINDLKNDFSHDEDYWNWFAKLQIGDSTNSKDLNKEDALSKLNKAIEVYEEALKVLPTVKMFSLYAKFLSDVFSPGTEDSISLLHAAGVNPSEFTSSILSLYEKAELTGCLNESLACEYVSIYLQLGRLVDAKNLAEKLCNGPLSNGVNLWFLRCSIGAKSLTNEGSAFTKDSSSSLFSLLKCAVSKVPISEAERLWLMAIELFSDNSKYFEKLAEMAILSLSSAGGSDSGASISCAIVGCVLQRTGIRHARKIYKRFLALPHPGLKFYRYCTELEFNLALVGESEALSNTRKLYESAISLFSQDQDLWRDYYKMELKVGTSETANAVYWRSRKTLNDLTALSVSGSL